MESKLNYASCKTAPEASAVLFSADTTAAGHSESHLGAQRAQSRVRTPEFLKRAANESPALPRNLSSGATLFDDGSLAGLTGLTAVQQIEAVQAKFLAVWSKKQIPFCIGGDHLIKHAALRALHESGQAPLVLYIDAHPDIAINETANYATVVHQAFVRDPALVERLFLVGLRQVNEAEREGLQEWRPNIIWAQDFYEMSLDEIYRPIGALKARFTSLYISIDLDGLDPSCAPAVEAPFPGGPHLPHLLGLIRRAAKDFDIVGFDLSEFMPDLDSTRITALTAATLLTEVVSCLKK